MKNQQKKELRNLKREFHELKEGYADAHLTEEERKLIAKAIEEEKQGKTISLADLKKHLKL